MRKSENLIPVLCLGLMLVLLALMITKNEKSEMYKIELDNVTVWCDKDGAVKDATNDRDKWIYRAVPKVAYLRAGDQLECYDLSTDVILKETFTIRDIKQDCWLCTE